VSEQHISAEVFPVWEFINDELHARKWSKERLAVEMGGDSDKNLFALDFLQHCPLDEGILLGEHTARQLAKAFGTSSELWLNLDKSAKAAIKAGRKYHPKPPSESEMSKEQKYIHLAHTLPSLAIISMALPYPMSVADFDAMVAAINSWRAGLTTPPQEPSDE
jgi:hypothetical protein